MENGKLFLNVTCLIEEPIPELYVFVGAWTVCVTHEKERKRKKKRKKEPLTIVNNKEEEGVEWSWNGLSENVVDKERIKKKRIDMR